MAQAERISTANRELMCRGQPLKSTNLVRAAQGEFVAAVSGKLPHAIYSILGLSLPFHFQCHFNKPP
jgi:hypothetical protein